MVAPRFETPAGSLNGVNKTFQTSVVYRPGSLRVWRNGMLNEGGLADGWVELSGNQFQMNEAPVFDDILRVYYLSA